ncbi:MAG: hypothetical protein PHX30_04370 [Candidatus Pacebacteria bacterium]|nr:hypothetical protein [Candidatus Paceibacterota bacterium]
MSVETLRGYIEKNPDLPDTAVVALWYNVPWGYMRHLYEVAKKHKSNDEIKVWGNFDFIIGADNFKCPKQYKPRLTGDGPEELVATHASVED